MMASALDALMPNRSALRTTRVMSGLKAKNAKDESFTLGTASVVT
ncbi:MAG: hypothetical protein QG640_100 [Patescibacteria group bacterium]|nr:hypothetical protein [Patescibacteria group bacterium]